MMCFVQIAMQLVNTPLHPYGEWLLLTSHRNALLYFTQACVCLGVYAVHAISTSCNWAAA